MKFATHSASNGLEELFAGVKTGDKAAFDEFYDSVKRPLFAYCLSIVRDEEDARDAFHTTMLKIYESRASFQGGNVHAWIFTIARNTSRSVMRHNKFSVAMPDGYDPPNDEQIGLAADESMLVQNAILSLGEEFRQVILLKYFGDLSVAEIAESENISVDLVKTRLFRARKQLADILGTTIELQS